MESRRPGLQPPEWGATLPPASAEYRGRLAHTHQSSVNLRDSAGAASGVTVFSVINAVTHPDLARALRSGSLHATATHGLLALPVVYHDPAARKFVLFLPDAIAHTELQERARVLGELAEETDVPVPPYVRDVAVVVGQPALEAYLASGAGWGLPSVALREEALAAREAAVAMREVAVLHAERDLAVREASLDERFNRLRAKEAALGGLAAAVPTGVDVSDEELDSLEDVSPDEVADADSAIDQLKPNDAARFAEAFAAAAVAEPSGEFEAIDPAEDLDVQTVVDTRAAGGAVAGSASGSIGEAKPTRTVRPPPMFLEQPSVELTAALSDVGVALFVRVSEGKEDAFAGDTSDIEVLAQLVDVQGYPVVVLALVKHGEKRPYVRRDALDPHDPEDRTILDALSTRFETEVFVYAPDGRMLESFRVASDRKENVRSILAKASEMPRPATLDRDQAVERALAAPPPAGGSGHPFMEPDLVLAPRELIAALPLLEKWSADDHKARAILVLSVPVADMESTFWNRLGQAVQVGIALPRALEVEALRRGLAPSTVELVERQIDHFAAHFRSGAAPIGLARGEVADNWEQLLERASELGVPVEPEVIALAWGAIRAVRAVAEDAEVLDSVRAESVPTLSTRALHSLLSHPTLRADAMLALAHRPAEIDTRALSAALLRLSPEDCVRVVPLLVTFGDRVGDGLLTAMASERSHIRLMAVLALGELKLRRAVVPLAELLMREREGIWREEARVLGRFGASAFRALSRFFRDPKGHGERLAYALAHLCLHGAEADVVRLASGDDPLVAALAASALALRGEASRDDARSQGGGALDGEESSVDASAESLFVRQFCRAVHEARSKPNP
jgi:hypothetical protein